MFPLVEFCQTNLSQGTQLVLEAVEAMDEVDVMVSSCLSECRFCEQQPFCLFEGERVGAKEPEELLALIEKNIREWHEEYS